MHAVSVYDVDGVGMMGFWIDHHPIPVHRRTVQSPAGRNGYVVPQRLDARREQSRLISVARWRPGSIAKKADIQLLNRPLSVASRWGREAAGGCAACRA